MEIYYVATTLLFKANDIKSNKNNQGKHVRLVFMGNSDEMGVVFNHLLNFDRHTTSRTNISGFPKPYYDKKKYVVRYLTIMDAPIFYEHWNKKGDRWIGEGYGTHENRMFNALLKIRRELKNVRK